MKENEFYTRATIMSILVISPMKYSLVITCILRSLQRALDRRLYLLLYGIAYGAPSGKPVWHFPEKVYESEDTMRKVKL